MASRAYSAAIPSASPALKRDSHCSTVSRADISTVYRANRCDGNRIDRQTRPEPATAHQTQQPATKIIDPGIRLSLLKGVSMDGCGRIHFGSGQRDWHAVWR